MNCYITISHKGIKLFETKPFTSIRSAIEWYQNFITKSFFLNGEMIVELFKDNDDTLLEVLW